jgi:hypothetical protein
MNESHVLETLKEALDFRVRTRLSPITESLKSIGVKSFYFAGNALNKEPHKDLDLFPKFKGQFQDISVPYHSKTKTILTVNINNSFVQFHNEPNGCLKDLVESFDFSNIRIGCEVSIEDVGPLRVSNFYFTDDYVDYLISGLVEYKGSQTPLSSLFRFLKYKERGYSMRKSEIFKILTDIYERGFLDSSDFDSQIADLGYAPNSVEVLDLKRVLIK